MNKAKMNRKFSLKDIHNPCRYPPFHFVSMLLLLCFTLALNEGSFTLTAFGQSENNTFLMSLDSTNSDDGFNGNDPLPQPEGVDVDSKGNVLVNDVEHNRINLFDNTGRLISTWGTSGDSQGQFNHPHGNEIDDDNSSVNNPNEVYVYVADQNNNRIQKFTMDGTFVTMWGEEGEEDGQFLHVHGVDVDSGGNVYVSDRDQPSIQKFTSDGEFIKKWGSQGTLEGQFIQPWDLAVSPDDRIFVPDHGNDRIQIFSSDGEYIASWGTSGTGPGQFDGPAVVAFDSNGNVYVTDSGNQRVQKFTSDGKFITEWGEKGDGDGQFSMPEGLAVDRVSGRVYVSDTSNNNVQVFVP